MGKKKERGREGPAGPAAGAPQPRSRFPRLVPKPLHPAATSQPASPPSSVPAAVSQRPGEDGFFRRRGLYPSRPPPRRCPVRACRRSAGGGRGAALLPRGGGIGRAAGAPALPFPAAGRWPRIPGTLAAPQRRTGQSRARRWRRKGCGGAAEGRGRLAAMSPPAGSCGGKKKGAFIAISLRNDKSRLQYN